MGHLSHRQCSDTSGLISVLASHRNLRIPFQHDVAKTLSYTPACVPYPHRWHVLPKRSTIPNALIARYPVTLSAADLLAAQGGITDQPDPIDFTPVPRLRRRRGGWTEQTQRDFIACLQRTGSVAASARAVDHRQHRLPAARGQGADSFAIAWDKAFEQGRRRIQEGSLDRALNGSLVAGVPQRNAWSASSIWP